MGEKYVQEGGRLDAKRHQVILAKALDGIWPVGHACAVLCWGTCQRSDRCWWHYTVMPNRPNTIQCLGDDDLMSLGIKSSAFLNVEHPLCQQFEVQNLW